MNNLNTTGYTQGTDTENNPYNIIPSSIITMKDVTKPLTLIPIIDGKPQYNMRKIAKPGDPDIDFGDGVTGVIEIPYAQGSYGMIGSSINPYPNMGTGINYGFNNNVPGIDASLEGFNYNTPQEINPGMNTNLTVPNSNYSLGTAPLPNFTPPPSTDQRIDNRARTMELSTDSLPAMGLDPNERQNQQAQNIKQQQQQQQQRRGQPFVGAINPYGGYNMQNASVMLGASIEDGNALGIIGSAGKIITEGARNAFSGAAAMKRFNESQDEYLERDAEARRKEGEYWATSYQSGGKVSRKNSGLLLTGNFLQGNDDHTSPNAEVEKGEYLQTPDGNTMEMVGKRHADGGELVSVPENTKVISDYNKIGGELATYFKKNYNLNLSAGSTFATVLDKYKKKIGLTEILEEESKIMTKVVDQEDVEFEGTKDINLQVLSKKINEIQSSKAPLDEQFNEFTNLVFEKQEELKAKEGENFEKQEGGEVALPQEAPTNIEPDSSNVGNIELIIQQFAELTGQDPQTIMTQLQQLTDEQLQQTVQQMVQMLQQASTQNNNESQADLSPNMEESESQQSFQKGGEVRSNWISEKVKSLMEEGKDVNQSASMAYSMWNKFQEGGQVHQYQKARNPITGSGRIMSAITANRKNPNEFDQYTANYKWLPDYDYRNTTAQAGRLSPILNQYAIAPEEGELDTQTGQDFYAGQVQNIFRNLFPKTTEHYSSNVAGTQQGLQTALDTGLVSEQDLKDLGVKVSDGKINVGSMEGVSEKNAPKITQLIQKRGKEKPEIFQQYVDKNFNDSKWYYRFPELNTVQFKDNTEKQNYLKKGDYELVEDSNGLPVYYSNKQGLYFTPKVEGEPEPAVTPENLKPDSITDENGNPINPWEPQGTGEGMELPMAVPDQSNLPPIYLQTSMRQVKNTQANRVFLSPEENLKELSKQANTASNALTSNNPYTSGAGLANLQAQQNNSINQAISQTTLANQQDERNVNNINEERIMKRDQTNLGLADKYERESIVGLDNYYSEYRNFIDNRNKQNVVNWNLQNQQNMFNAMNPNYKIGSMGQIYQTDEPFVIYVNGQQQLFDPKTKQVVTQKTTSPDGKTSQTVQTTRGDNKNRTSGRGKQQKGGMIITSSLLDLLK